MKPEKLIDKAIQAAYKKNSAIVPPSYRERLINAHKFILSDSMSEYLSDLSTAAFMVGLDKQKIYPQKMGDLFETGNPVQFAHLDIPEQRIEYIRTIIDGARRLARAPHPIVWIEYNNRARRKRSLENYPGVLLSSNHNGIPIPPEGVPIDEVIGQVGWLIEQHPSIETAYKMTEFVESENNVAMALPYSTTWVTDDDTVLPWRNFAWNEAGRSPSEVATGIMGYQTDTIGITPTPDSKGISPQAMKDLMLETMGELRTMLTLLATINKLPVKYDVVRPAKGMLAGGQYRKFMSHSTITLNVPSHRSLRTLAIRAVVQCRRKAHEVRGHWRNDWRHPRTPGCMHVWVNKDEQHLICENCRGQLIHIPPHARGDARLGYVQHDYVVNKPAA